MHTNIHVSWVLCFPNTAPAHNCCGNFLFFRFSRKKHTHKSTRTHACLTFMHCATIPCMCSTLHYFSYQKFDIHTHTCMHVNISGRFLACEYGCMLAHSFAQAQKKNSKLFITSCRFDAVPVFMCM
jgi:hypothetical protein